MSVELSSLLTQAVREVVPVLLRRQLSYAFDHHGCDWRVPGAGRALQASFHRLLLGASELLHRGFVAVRASAHSHPLGGCSLRLHVGGSGNLRDDGTLERTLAGLSLAPTTLSRRGLQRAQGLCPAAKVAVDFSCLPAAGFLFRATYRLRDAEDSGPQPAASAAVSGAPLLWLVHADSINAASVARQAQSHGWAVTQMASLEEAAGRLREAGTGAGGGAGPGAARPAMLLVFACDGAPPSALQAVRGLLPARAHLAYAAEVGSIWWRDGIEGSLPVGCEVCCHPLGNAEWQRWAGSLRPGAVAPLPAARRTPVLVVDDDEVCCCLAEALLDALGCETRLVHDGQQAIDRCCDQPPALVLMDLDMPRLDGFEATRRLRAMQRAGLLPPFRILATSSAPDRSWITDAMEAGCDTFLPKPLRVETLRGELARWCAGSHGMPEFSGD